MLDHQRAYFAKNNAGTTTKNREFIAASLRQLSVKPILISGKIVRNRVKTEIFNQAFGVEKGDEVEAQRDPVILKAIEVIGG